MIHEIWEQFINTLAEKGVPLYRLTDPLDDAGVPSWAIALALALILFFALVFVVFPGIKYSLTVTTTPDARVTVTYGEARAFQKAENGTAVFSVPLGASASIQISKEGCEGTSVEVTMFDHYAFEKRLVCE